MGGEASATNSSPPVRLMLDTNVWTYVFDYGGANELRKVTREAGADVMISPAVVYEQLRMTDTSKRRKHIELTTRQLWARMMPEAYVECDEIVEAIRKHRPGWLHDQPPSAALDWYRLNERDWRRAFWQRARKDPARTAASTDALGGKELQYGRDNMEKIRAERLQAGLQPTAAAPEGWTSTVRCVNELGRVETIETDTWRFEGANYSWHQLQRREATTYRDWLDPFVDWAAVDNEVSWLRFWMDVEATEVPTSWLRFAAANAATLTKVNEGSPGDVQLATYLHRCDVFASGDKRLIRIVELLHEMADFPIARPLRVWRGSWQQDLRSGL